MMNNLIKPTDSELEILNILWEKGHATVKEVNEEINKTKESGYTTTLKLLQIMHEKGLVSRYPTGKQHVYQAKIEEEKAQKDILNGFMHNLYRGNAMKMVMQILGNHNTTKDELEQLRQVINSLEQKS
ncbi:MAG: BlaI/MecI/CopY family transcriptional regulator [Spirosomataceae bacterium]|jgi:predicted transcriptional regulator